MDVGTSLPRHYAIFRMAEVAVPRELFGRILDRIATLRPPDPNVLWPICFEWPSGSPGPVNVEITDYH